MKFKAGDDFALHPRRRGCLEEMELSMSCVPGFKVEPDVVVEPASLTLFFLRTIKNNIVKLRSGLFSVTSTSKGELSGLIFFLIRGKRRQRSI